MKESTYKKKKTGIIILGIILAAICFWSCVVLLFSFWVREYYATPNYITRKLEGVDVSEGEIVYEIDDHGGFFGEGKMVVQIQFSDENFGKVLGEVSKGWKAFPLSADIRNALQMLSDEDEQWEFEFLDVRHGYWYFYDRHYESKDPYDDSKLHSRFSYNYTVGICDTDKKRVYYIEQDT